MRRRYFERYGVVIEADPRVQKLEKDLADTRREVRAWELRFRENLPVFPEEWEWLAHRFVKPTTLPWTVVDAPAAHRQMVTAFQRCTCTHRLRPGAVDEALFVAEVMPQSVFTFNHVGVYSSGVHYWLGQCPRCTKVWWCRTHGA